MIDSDFHAKGLLMGWYKWEVYDRKSGKVLYAFLSQSEAQNLSKENINWAARKSRN